MAFPQILAISSGSSTTAATTHTLQYPSGTTLLQKYQRVLS